MPHIRNPSGPVVATSRPRAGIAWRRAELLTISAMASCLEALIWDGCWVVGLWAKDFCMVKNGVLAFDFAVWKKSIGEVFESHVDLTALSPIWPVVVPMAESTALPTCLLLAWHAVITMSVSNPLNVCCSYGNAAMLLSEDSRVHLGALLAVISNPLYTCCWHGMLQ